MWPHTKRLTLFQNELKEIKKIVEAFLSSNKSKLQLRNIMTIRQESYQDSHIRENSFQKQIK